MKTRHHFRISALFALLLSATAHSATIDAYPTKPVRIILPVPAGGAADNVTRPVARKLTDYWGKQIVIDSRAGIPGLQVAAKSTADGYTLLLGAGSSMVTGPLMHDKKHYDPQKDFIPISRLVTIKTILTTHPSVSAKSTKELITLAKSKPGTLNFSSSGLGNPGHLAMELFMSMTGTRMVHIPYKGGAQSVIELVGGQVQLGFNAIPSVLTHVKDGKLRALAIASMERSRALPDIPTINESAVPGFNYDIWYGIFAPAKTPPAIIEKISANIQKALGEPDVTQLIISQGAEPAPTTSRELGQIIKDDTVRWTRIVKDLNLKVE